MQISRARIQGFRCLDDVEIEFDNVTTLIGPNGVGKSSVLRALDWFFNDEALEPRTAHGGPDQRRFVQVEVEFTALTNQDRQALGRYADGRNTVLLWKTHEDGQTWFSGNARQYPAFAAIRAADGAKGKRALYADLRTEKPELGLPAATSGDQVLRNLESWEAAHPSELESVEVSESTSFFGFRKQAKLSGIFDYVFISADLRAEEEAKDTRSALIGRLLEMAIDRSAVDSELQQQIEDLNARNATVVQDKIGEDLDSLGSDLSGLVDEIAPGRRVTVRSSSLAIKQPQVQLETVIIDGKVETQVGAQGHGFQRALLVSVLRMLAERGRTAGSSGSLFLAVEEPELYQHPAQARLLARTFRDLTQERESGIQVAYATHSPLFIEPGQFHQLRRFRRVNREGEQGIPATEIRAGRREHIVTALAGLRTEEQVLRQVDKMCPSQLAEAVFADSVLLVEGETGVRQSTSLSNLEMDSRASTH